MTDKTSPAEQQRAFNLIWSQMPEMQNRMSSSWWFFLLFPKGEEGYGPKQIMFAITARVGDTVGITGVEIPGIDLQRPKDPRNDQFDVVTVGWYCDGEQVYDPLLRQKALATLSSDGYIQAPGPICPMAKSTAARFVFPVTIPWSWKRISRAPKAKDISLPGAT